MHAANCSRRSPTSRRLHAVCSPPALRCVLGEWEALAHAAYREYPTGVQLLDVVMGEMGRRSVPFEYVHGLLRGMHTDIDGPRFATLDELRGYCHDVASVVGLWLTELFGVHDRWTLDRAAQLGGAMQLTNIARDVGEAWRRGRMYLPPSMLDEYGVTTQMIEKVQRGSACRRDLPDLRSPRALRKVLCNVKLQRAARRPANGLARLPQDERARAADRHPARSADPARQSPHL
ncbi:MAG: squalene/phytoene synthase family protein [Gemmatimonadaceae bacterium]